MSYQAFGQSPVSRRAFVAGMLAAGSSIALAGCNQSSVAESIEDITTETDDDSDTTPLLFAVFDLATIDPYACTDDVSRQVVSQMFDPLTRYDYEEGVLEGLAAESWDVSDDATEFTFHLVEGATFHNGEAVDAASFKRAWERIVDPESTVAELYGASGAAYHLSLVEGYEALAAGEASSLSGVSCPDDETLVVKLTTSYADFPYVVAEPALSPVPYAATSDPEGFFGAPIGNGPLMMAEDATWEEGQSLDLVRFDGHHGEAATVEEVEFVPLKDADAGYRELESGGVDVTEVPVDGLSSVRKDAGLSMDGCTMSEDERLIIGVEPVVSFLVCNTGRIPLNNLDVRRGISLSIDRESICDDVYDGVRIAADGVVPPGVAGYREGAWEYADFDGALAAELLEKAYPADDEGVRDLALGLMYYEGGGHEELVAAIVEDLGKVGVTLEAEALGWDALVERYAAGEFDLGLMSWTAEYPTLDNVLYPLFHSNCLGGSNRSGYSSEEVDTAIDEARALVDDEERTAKLQEVDTLVGETLPVIPLMYYTHVLAGSDRIEYLYCDPEGTCDLTTAVLAE